jgi:hypothetical protein
MQTEIRLAESVFRRCGRSVDVTFPRRQRGSALSSDTQVCTRFRLALFVEIIDGGVGLVAALASVNHRRLSSRQWRDRGRGALAGSAWVSSRYPPPTSSARLTCRTRDFARLRTGPVPHRASRRSQVIAGLLLPWMVMLKSPMPRLIAMLLFWGMFPQEKGWVVRLRNGSLTD